MNYEACCICGDRRFKLISRMTNDTSIVKCLGCDVARTYPYPDFDFSSQEKYSKFYIDNERMFRMFARSMMDVIKPYKTGVSILDIGCAVGYLLDEARISGFKETCGIELNIDAASIARSKGHHVYAERLENIDIGKDRFDVVLFNHVLEHIPDIKRFLGSVRRILKNDGIVYTGAPNYNSLMRLWLGKNWYGWGMPDHIWHFEAATFRQVMENNAFKVKRLSQNAMYYPYSKSLRKNTRATVARIAGVTGFGDQVYGVFCK